MIPEIGHFSLILALAFSFVLAILPMMGSLQKNPDWIRLAKPAAIGQFVFLGLSFALLMTGFFQDDFSVKYVANNSNTTLPLLFKISATWGAHEGSLLLWALILALWTLAVAFFSRSLPDDLSAKMLSVMGMIAVGFLFFILLTSNPFERMMDIPQEGRSLNPLLQDFGLAIHPPMLYMGYVGMVVAFAFAVAILLQGEFKSAWAHWAKSWAMIAWAFLTVGIALGSWWAYYELGWGGWWFWDPVENASLLPWIVATALIHTLSITANRGTFQSWTLLLAILAFSLSLLGTFLVRSGVLTSVHAFTSDPSRGVFILIFLVIVVGSSLLLYSTNVHKVAKSKPFKMVSKETLLLLNNVILVAMMATVLLGTLYPLILDALGVAKISVGAPYFNTVMLPLMIPLAFFMGLGFITQWREDSEKRLLSRLKIPLIASLATAFIVPLLLIPEFNGLATIGLLMSSWIAFTALYWFSTQFLAQPTDAQNVSFISRVFGNLSAKTSGATLAHLGFAVALTGITLTSVYSIEKDVRLEKGQHYTINEFKFEFKGVTQSQNENYLASRGLIRVFQNDAFLVDLYPEKRTYMTQGMPMTEAGIDAKLSRDLFVALGERLSTQDQPSAWSVRLQYKPFVRWIWLGSLMMAAGGLLTLFSRRQIKRDPALTKAATV